MIIFYRDGNSIPNLKVQHCVLGLPSFDEIPYILKMVGLENTGRKKARDFSLGMRQRLGIAVAMVGSPDFLVLDEPTNGLDPQGIVEIREIILKLNHQNGITILISSHILDEMARLATHFGFIDKGQMIKEISASELNTACRKCIHVSVSNIKTLSKVLDEMGLDYTIFPNNEADIFGELNITELVLKLSVENCDVKSIYERDESLENYYINLLGGRRNV